MSLTNEAAVATPAADSGPALADLVPDAFFPVGVELSPDGSAVAYVRSTRDGNHTLLVQEAAPDGAARELAVLRGHSVMSLAWAPDGGCVAVNTATEDNPIPAIHLYALEGGEPRIITGPKGYPAMMGGSPFNHTGTALAFATVGRDPSIVDVVIHNLADGQHIRVEGVTGKHLVPVEFSPDDQWLSVLTVVDNTSHGMALIDLTTNTLTEVIPAEGRNDGGLWLADSSGFYFSTNHDREFEVVARYCLADNSVTIVAERAWDIEGFGFRGDTSVIITNADGVDVLEVDYQGRTLDLPDAPAMAVIAHSSLTQDGKRLCLMYSSPSRAPEITVMDLPEGTEFTLTDTQPAGLRELHPVAPQLVRFDTPDRESISAWLYRPDTEDPTPVVLFIHGGPEVQERPDYHATTQWFLSRGIAVLAPNIHGSTGYGRRFQEAIYGDWGGIDLVDLRAAVEYLRDQPWVRADKIVAVGESYGGFAVLSCLTRMADLDWAGGVAGAAPSDLYAMSTSSPQTWTVGVRTMIGDAVRDRDRLVERSPVNHVANLRAPLMVRHPVRDQIIRADQADRFVREAHQAGADVTYVSEAGAEHGALDFAEHIARWTDICAWVQGIVTS